MLVQKFIKMNTQFNNVTLFIKRAEEYQTKEFIIEAFASNNIGKVRDVKFIKKQNDGRSYNGVIVMFERWNMNNTVQRLFNEMSTSTDGTTKFYFDNHRYWIINVHKQNLPGCEEIAVVDASLPDKEKIVKLEELVRSMSAQIHYMQTQQEKSERIMMDLERKETQHHLINMELRYQLAEKDLEKSWFEDECKERFDKLQEENEMLRNRLALAAIDMIRKDIQIEKLNEELRETTCIVSYIENRADEMKQLLKSVSEKDSSKSNINSYLREYSY